MVQISDVEDSVHASYPFGADVCFRENLFHLEFSVSLLFFRDLIDEFAVRGFDQLY